MRNITQLIKSFRAGIMDVTAGLTQQGMVAVFGFISTMIMARGLGSYNMGLVSLALSVSGVAASLSDLGIGQTAIRYGSRELAVGDKESAFRVFRWGFRVRILQSLAISMVFLFLAPYLGKLWGNTAVVSLIRWSLILGILGALAHIPNVYLQSVRHFWLNAGVAIFQALVSLIGIIVLKHYGWWTPLAVLTNAIWATLVGTVAVIFLIPKETLVKYSRDTTFSLNNLKSMFKAPTVTPDASGQMTKETPQQFSRFLMFSSLLVMVYTRLDVWILGSLQNPSVVGAYAIANKMVLPLSMVLGALNAALWPRVSAITDKQGLRNLIKRTLVISILCAIPLTVYALAGPVLIPILFGNQYRPAMIPAEILGIRYIVDILVCPLGIVGYNLGMVKLFPFINLVQMIVMVCLSLVFLRTYGAAAVAFGILLADVVGLVISTAVLYRRINTGVNY